MTGAPVTPSQTIGPFFHHALLRIPMNVVACEGTGGERVRVEGRVLDGDGAPVSDAMVEIWQANEHGRYNHPADRRDLPLDPRFTGFGRSGTDESGRYWFETVKPGPVPFDAQRMQAPHLLVTVFSRGILNHLVTRLYFGDESANGSDPVLQSVPAEQRETVIATRREADGAVVYELDIVMQGEGETAFFAV